MKFQQHSLFSLIAFFGLLVAPISLANAQIADDGMVDVPGITDISKAEILKIHLHMSGREAISTLEQEFHIKFAPVCGPGRPNCFNSLPTLYTPGHNYVGILLIRTPKIVLTVEFTESFPYDVRQPETLISINYHPELKTDEDTASFTTQAIQKYGPAVTRGVSAIGGSFATWCNRGLKRSDAGYDCDGQGPTINFAGRQLQLYDWGIRPQQEQRWNATKSATAPAL